MRHLKQQKIRTPYAARVCICIGITSTFHRESLEPQRLQAFFVAFRRLFSLKFSLYRLETPLMYCSIRSALACFISSVTWPYTSSVKEAVAWPRFSCTVLRSSPARREATAKLWRRSCRRACGRPIEATRRL